MKNSGQKLPYIK